MWLLLVLACGDKDNGNNPTDDSGGGGGGGGDTGTTPVITACDTLGLPVMEWQEAVEDTTLKAVAADFTVETLEFYGSDSGSTSGTSAGTWNFKESFTGCETYLFIPEEPKQATGWPDPLWDSRSDVTDLYAALPKNTHVFFVPASMNAEDRLASLSDMQDKVENAIEDLEWEDQEWWRAHTHYVDQTSAGVDGWLGDVLTSPGWGVGIDRFQQIRYIGSFADPERYNSSYGWFEPNISMAAQEPVYYNFEADRQAMLDADGATVVRVFDNAELSDGSWAGVRGYADVELPSAAEMEGFDTLTMDLTLDCVGEGEYGTCPAWDYIVWLYLCEEDDPDTCSTEVGRWITTYHREGRWVHDTSAILPLLANGGTRRFAFYTTQLYGVTLDLRFSNQGIGSRPVESTPLFAGGGLSDTYNTRDPIEVEIPADAAAVELVTVISGHGMESPGNCAEFCNIDHHFSVDGTDNVIEYTMAGNTWGCLEQTGIGTVPNQYGTWWYGRNGWCPGKEVPMTVTDITDQVTPGATATIDYEAFYNGGIYTNGAANIQLSSWLVVRK